MPPLKTFDYTGLIGGLPLGTILEWYPWNKNNPTRTRFYVDLATEDIVDVPNGGVLVNLFIRHERTRLPIPWIRNPHSIKSHVTDDWLKSILQTIVDENKEEFSCLKSYSVVVVEEKGDIDGMIVGDIQYGYRERVFCIDPTIWLCAAGLKFVRLERETLSVSS